MPTTTQNLCYNCFQNIEDPSGPCPYCGFDREENRQKFPVALQAGTVLNSRYIVGRVLGQGGFGITYVAFDTQLQTRVAIKEYMPNEIATRIGGTTVSAAMDTRAGDFTYGAERFMEEARTLAKFIGHPNIAGVSSYFDENGTSYFVMDYIEGISFKRYIANAGGKVSVDEALNVMIPVLRALTAVHAEGFVHRDVTPDNIYISKDGNVKLLDFGSARYSIGDKSKSLDVILKVGYAPKEQYTRRGRQGPYTDVYSCAACFYAALTGYLPPESLDRLEHDTLTPVSQIMDIPDWLDRAILKGLAVQPEDRFQSAAEFLDAIENRLLVEVPAAASSGQTVPTPAPAKKKPLPLIIGGAATVLAVAIGLGVFLGSRSGQPQNNPGPGQNQGGPSQGQGDLWIDPAQIPGDPSNAPSPDISRPSGNPGWPSGNLSPDVSQPSSDPDPASGPVTPAAFPVTIAGEEHRTDETSLSLWQVDLEQEDIDAILQMKALETLSIYECYSDDGFAFLPQLPNLKDLSWTLNNAAQLENLSGCTGLTKLNFGWGSGKLTAKNLDFLAGLTELEYLSIHIRGLEDISALANLTKLTYFSIDGAQKHADLSVLAGMTQMQELYINQSNILTDSSDKNTYCADDLSFLSNMTELKKAVLIMEGNLKDLSGLEGAVALRDLYLEAGAVSSLAPLASLVNLRTLRLDVSSTVSLEPLRNLEKLETFITFSHRRMTDWSAVEHVPSIDKRG